MPLDLFFVWIDSLYMSCNLRLLSNYHKKPMHTVEPYIARVYSNTTQTHSSLQPTALMVPLLYYYS